MTSPDDSALPGLSFLRDRDRFLQRFVLAQVLGPPPSKRRRPARLVPGPVAKPSAPRSGRPKE